MELSGIDKMELTLFLMLNELYFIPVFSLQEKMSSNFSCAVGTV